MNVYLTGNIQESDSGNKALFAALAFDGNYIPIIAEYTGKESAERTIVKAMKIVYNKVHTNQKYYYDSRKKMSFHTDLLADNYSETIRAAYASEEITNTKRYIADHMFDEIDDHVDIEIDNLDIVECKETLMEMTYHPDEFKGYRFKNGDFVVCASHEQTPSSHVPYARVVSVNREDNTLVLDKYLDSGRVQFPTRAVPLHDFELAQYYRPMEHAELTVFRDGLKELLGAPEYRSGNKVKDKASAKETYDKVSEILDRKRDRGQER